MVYIAKILFGCQAYRHKASIRRKPLMFLPFVMVLPTSLPQLGCVGSTSGKNPASSKNPSLVPPSIAIQPAIQAITSGQTATFCVAGTGTPPLTYQWRENGASIIGASSAIYTTVVTTMPDNGSLFAVIVSNSAGSVTSNPATLTVNAAAVAPSINTQPASQTVTAGQTVTFSGAASGTAPLSYQWKRSETAVSGATSTLGSAEIWS